VEGEFARWYEAEGQNLPIIISQTNSPSNEFRQQRSVMIESLSMLQEFNPIVAIGWYADRDPFDAMSSANLLQQDGSLTDLGHSYAGLDKNPQP